MEKTVLVGMSGGVDSSVAALLLKKKGYNVVGVFMKNYSRANSTNGECTWIDERAMALRIAAILEIPLITMDSEKEYREKVIGKMYEDYERGLTPNPDTLCNKIIKFPLLWKKAREMKIDYIATGHYARIRKGKKGFELLMGKDRNKDQSYFLCDLIQRDLEHTLFPVGDMTKDEVREIAQKNNFPNWNKKGTSGICFVGKVDMKDFLKEKIKETRGKVVTGDGNVIGTHPGNVFFTIGERVGEGKGIEIDRELKKWSNEKLYVCAKLKGNKLMVAPEGDDLLKTRRVFIRNLKWINLKESKGLKARIRHLGKLYSGKLSWKGKKTFFEFRIGIEGIAPGQKIVFYKGEKLIAGGDIR